MVNFSERLKKLRKEAGYTQQQLADRIWVTKATISYYELSEHTPSPEILVKLAAAFHVTTDYLLGLEEKGLHLDVSDLPAEDIELLEHTIRVLRNKNQSRA
ncbi:MAG: helix-turn-helix transcriptional regulator [Oscillospiraceae bacterium]|nr:helix-turn-helix transcriptional regulator [Oscillospiraceae bacterium]